LSVYCYKYVFVISLITCIYTQYVTMCMMHGTDMYI
jgi:hypothetical protein